MKRLTLAAGAMLAVSVPAVADAKSVTPRHARQYAQLYHRVAGKFGHRAAGRNIVRWGENGHAASDAQVVASIGVLERMLVPPPGVAPAADGVTPVTQASVANPPAAGAGYTAAGSSYPGAGGSPTAAGASAPSGSPLPACTWQPESGGNPSAVNPSSGAGGYYQITPGTWAAYGGTGAPQSAPMSEQTAIAQKIYQSQGPSAWTNC